MKYALLGDLHSSIEDTKAVLHHIHRCAPGADIIGLGDLYECTVGKRKAETMRNCPVEKAAIRSEAFDQLLTFPSVRGNQEERIMKVTGTNEFSKLPEKMIIDGAVLIHGHQWKWTADWLPLVPKIDPPLLFFGHSHEAALYRKKNRLPFEYGKPVVLKKKRYAINAGAVWGSREWVLYDAAARTVTFMKAD
ncbi:metallophosphoesterase family protein [Domibacillus enclensis]|uniref:Calcineurin-like phosphoesterase superfamily domain-containing protein n=1 Tax=Domibacillus enclensis TaxID=1017273 RepID=A0A1N6ZI62_9BACI|nr:metallophosphoesterase family protein [Domibacillus enclensis]OXS76711.1 metallophosphatase family protein [Domibacillus enclensis]SIR26477.1 Calcineurin-like phosphoesterase superfamily domain-containing protein [Domibacillus enclensis]